MGRKLLVIDTSYGYEAIENRGLQYSVTCRDLDGFFEHVWSVHPFASLVGEGRTTKFGKPDVHLLGTAHTFVDGKMGRFRSLDRWPAINFLASQGGLLGYLAGLIREHQISVIRTGDPLYNGAMGLVLARMCGIPLVIRINANYDRIHAATRQPMMPRMFGSYGREKRLMRFVLRQADLVAAVNADNLEFAVENGARREATTIFAYGNLIDKRHLTVPKTRDSAGVLNEFWREPRRFLLHVGRLEPVKYPDHPIRVLAEVRRRGHDVACILVGDGSLRYDLRALADELGVAEHVIFAGNRDQGWLARVIPQATVALSPLTGRALTEVAFGGVPIVAYDLDWQGELIRTGETGELVSAGSWERMADAVERFLQDPEYARAMGVGVRARAEEMLDAGALDQHERDEYERLLARWRTRRR